MKEVILVEILMVHYKKGDKEHSRYLNKEIEYSVPEWSTVSDKNMIASTVLAFEPDLIFTEDCTCFSFRFIGQNFDKDSSGGMEWESMEAGVDYIFEGWVDELKKLALIVKKDKVEQGLEIAKDSNAVRFVTAWEWTCWRDSYYGEWDSEWNLLGLVDLKQIEKCLVKNE